MSSRAYKATFYTHWRKICLSKEEKENECRLNVLELKQNKRSERARCVIANIFPFPSNLLSHKNIVVKYSNIVFIDFQTIINVVYLSFTQSINNKKKIFIHNASGLHASNWFMGKWKKSLIYSFEWWYSKCFHLTIFNIFELARKQDSTACERGQQ